MYTVCCTMRRVQGAEKHLFRINGGEVFFVRKEVAMLDIKFVRENPDVVRQNIKNKFQDRKLPLVDEVLELDIRNREIKKEVEALRAEDEADG